MLIKEKYNIFNKNPENIKSYERCILLIAGKFASINSQHQYLDFPLRSTLLKNMIMHISFLYAAHFGATVTDSMH